MKTQLVYLDAQDDSASTLERLRWSQADRVVLIWPSHGRLLQRRLDLVLLSREATRQAAQLGIVVHDPEVRQTAASLGIAVFDDLDSVSRQAWPARASPQDLGADGRRRADLPAAPARSAPAGSASWGDAQRAASMLFVILALLALSIVIGPAAVVELTPVERHEAVSLPVSFIEGSEPAVEGIALPVRRLAVEVEGKIQRPTAGVVLSPTSSATGEVLLTNRSGAEIDVPKGTGLRTTDGTNLRFETVEAATVPEGIGAQVLAPIQASAAGVEGNVPAGSIDAMEGTLGLELTVANPEPTSGGTTESRPGVTEVDLRQAEAALHRQILQSANASLQEMLGPNEVLAPDSVVVAEVHTASFEPAVGEASEAIEGSMSARVEATAYDADRLQRAAETAVVEAIGPDRALMPQSTRVELVPVGAADRPEYQARIEASSRAAADPGYLARAITGRTSAQAVALLRGLLELESPARIRLWPGWWPRLPFLPLRIQSVWVSATS